MKLIIYMPAMNEEENIPSVINLLPRALAGIDHIEYLVVDDGSTDHTVAISKSLGASVVSHGRNRGVGAAFQSAVQYSLEYDADILVGIDADGQFDAKEIPLLIAPILDHKADMVIGNRFPTGKPANMPAIKYFGNNIIAKLIGMISGQQFSGCFLWISGI